jgi:hypothetical protein
MMKTKLLLSKGILDDGDPRHFAAWDFPGPPRLTATASLTPGEALYQRQKAYAPRTRSRGGLVQIIDALRKSS